MVNLKKELSSNMSQTSPPTGTILIIQVSATLKM